MALGLMLVFEGLLPLCLPRHWKDTMRQILALRDGQLRFFGLVALVLGLAVVLFSYYAGD